MRRMKGEVKGRLKGYERLSEINRAEVILGIDG